MTVHTNMHSLLNQYAGREPEKLLHTLGGSKILHGTVLHTNSSLCQDKIYRTTCLKTSCTIHALLHHFLKIQTVKEPQEHLQCTHFL